MNQKNKPLFVFSAKLTLIALLLLLQTTLQNDENNLCAKGNCMICSETQRCLQCYGSKLKNGACVGDPITVTGCLQANSEGCTVCLEGSTAVYKSQEDHRIV